jgi:hypothetical protein
MEMLALVLFMSSITLYSKSCVSGLFVVVFGCGMLAFLLTIGLLGLVFSIAGLGRQDSLLFVGTPVRDLSLAVVGAGVLGFKVMTGGVIFLRGVLVFMEEDMFGKIPLMRRL